MNDAAQRELATADYWNKRYNDEKAGLKQDDGEEYEWFKTYEKLKPFFAKHLPPATANPKILQLGCGTSPLTANLYQDGYKQQVNIDFSSAAIETMKQRYEDLALEWMVIDVRKMELPEAGFDVGIDKGTLDAMLHGSPWNPGDDVKDNVGAYVDEVVRVLKPGGKWLYITYSQPRFLKPLLRRDKVWDVQVEVLEDAPGTFQYFGFVMTKQTESKASS